MFLQPEDVRHRQNSPGYQQSHHSHPRTTHIHCLAQFLCDVLQRWAVYNACDMLSKYDSEYRALQKAMGDGKDIPTCIRAIEEA